MKTSLKIKIVSFATFAIGLLFPIILIRSIIKNLGVNYQHLEGLGLIFPALLALLFFSGYMIYLGINLYKIKTFAYKSTLITSIIGVTGIIFGLPLTILSIINLIFLLQKDVKAAFYGGNMSIQKQAIGKFPIILGIVIALFLITGLIGFYYLDREIKSTSNPQSTSNQ